MSDLYVNIIIHMMYSQGGFYTFVDEKTCLVNVNNQYFYIKNWLFIIYSKSYVDKEIYNNP